MLEQDERTVSSNSNTLSDSESGLRSTGIAIPSKKYAQAIDLDQTSDSLVIEFYSNTDNSVDNPESVGLKKGKDWIKPLKEMLAG
jgi:hypothetical protein